MNKIWVLLVFLCVSAFSIEEDSQIWFQGILQTPLTGNLNAYIEVQPRFDQQASRLQRILIRPALYYSLTEELTVWGGYLWNPAFAPSRNNEHRIWEQLIYTKKIGDSILMNRLRFEQRFFDSTSNVALRIRNLLRFQHHWFVIYDEIFFQFSNGYDQNRAFIGFHFKYNENVALDAGYMNNHIANAPNDRMNHIFLVTLFLRTTTQNKS